MEGRRMVPIAQDVSVSAAALLFGSINPFRGAPRTADVTYLCQWPTFTDGDAPGAVGAHTGAMTESGVDPAPGLDRSGGHDERSLRASWVVSVWWVANET